MATRPDVSSDGANAGTLMCRPVRREARTTKRRGVEEVAERYAEYLEQMAKKGEARMIGYAGDDVTWQSRSAYRSTSSGGVAPVIGAGPEGTGREDA